MYGWAPPITLQHPKRSYSPRRSPWCGLLNSKMLFTSGIQQGWCSSSPDRPLSFAVWGPAGPIVLKVGLYSGGLIPKKGPSCTTGAIQYGRAFGSQSGSLNPERGPLKLIRGPPCTTESHASWKDPFFPHSRLLEPRGPCSPETGPIVYNRGPCIMEWSPWFPECGTSSSDCGTAAQK